MSYQNRIIQTVKYGRFAEFVSIVNELNELCVSRGWAPTRVLTPMAGVNNQVILEIEYPDLATLEREMDAFYGDPEVMKVWRSAADLIIEGSGHSEILSDVPTIA